MYILRPSMPQSHHMYENLPHIDVTLLEREKTGPLVARFREALLTKLADRLIGVGNSATS